MSYIVRKKIDGGNIEVVGKLCEMRNLEAQIDGQWVAADRNKLKDYFGNKLNPSKSSLSLRKRGSHHLVNMVLSDNALSFEYDSDYGKEVDKEGLTIFGLLLSDTGQPTDAYLQAATALYADNNGLQYDVHADYVGEDQKWYVGDLDIVVGTNLDSQMLGQTAV